MEIYYAHTAAATLDAIYLSVIEFTTQETHNCELYEKVGWTLLTYRRHHLYLSYQWPTRANALQQLKTLPLRGQWCSFRNDADSKTHMKIQNKYNNNNGKCKFKSMLQKATTNTLTADTL